MRCLKCQMDIDTPGLTCPLCRSPLKEKENVDVDPTYPRIKKGITQEFINKILLFTSILISAIAIFLNVVLTPAINWAVFVIAGVLSLDVIFLGIIKGRRRILSMMFYMCFLVILVTNMWDKVTGYSGWSLNYVLPILCIGYGIFLIFLRFISYFAFKENSFYIYLHVILEFLPLILFYKGIVNFKILAVISAVFGLINFLVLIFFDASKLKEDLAKKLHI